MSTTSCNTVHVLKEKDSGGSDSRMTFGSIDPKSHPSVLKYTPLKECLLVDKGDAPSDKDFVIQFVLDECYTQEKVRAFCRYVEMKGVSRYRVFCALKYDVSKIKIAKSKQAKRKAIEEGEDEDSLIKSGIIEFYTNHQSDFYNRLIPGNPVITFGPALYAVTCTDDVYPIHTQQIIFGKHSFWYSRELSSKGNFLYPCESLDVLFGDGAKWGRPIDSYKTQLFNLQLKTALSDGRKIIRYPALKKYFISSEEEFDKVFYEPNKDRKGDFMAWDLETSSLDHMTGVIGCITISFDGVTGYYIPWKYVDTEKLDKIMENNLQIGANLKFDLKFVWKPHKRTRNIEGYRIIEVDGQRYKVMNHQQVRTARGDVWGSSLTESDDILDFSTLEPL